MKIVAILLLSASLAGCCDAACRVQAHKDSEDSDRFYAGEVQKVRTAPDGTVLWRAWDRLQERTVYFSTHGTSYQEGCGKACTRDVTVPSPP
jgi:hypothetical protein